MTPDPMSSFSHSARPPSLGAGSLCARLRKSSASLNPGWSFSVWLKSASAAPRSPREKASSPERYARLVEPKSLGAPTS